MKKSELLEFAKWYNNMPYSNHLMLEDEIDEYLNQKNDGAVDGAIDGVEYHANGDNFTADKLKPCPFCGSETNIIFKGNNWTKTRELEIKCSNSRCRVKVIHKALRNPFNWLAPIAINQWNKRI